MAAESTVGLGAVEREVETAQIEAQIAQIELARIDLDARRVERGQRAHVHAHIRQIQIHVAQPGGQRALIDRERRADGVAVDGEQGLHAEAGSVLVLDTELLAGEHVDAAVAS